MMLKKKNKIKKRLLTTDRLTLSFSVEKSVLLEGIQISARIWINERPFDVFAFVDTESVWNCGGEPVLASSSGQGRQVPVWLYGVAILMKEVQ